MNETVVHLPLWAFLSGTLTFLGAFGMLVWKAARLVRTVEEHSCRLTRLEDQIFTGPIEIEPRRRR